MENMLVNYWTEELEYSTKYLAQMFLDKGKDDIGNEYCGGDCGDHSCSGQCCNGSCTG